MFKKITYSLLFVSLLGLYACKDKLVDNPAGNQPPVTKLFLNPDSTISEQQSKISLFWSGDDPDGQIAGFYFSWDGENWTYTTKNDSTFSLQIGAVDTIFSFRVAAVDNNGNGKYDATIIYKEKNIGHEPFTDLNGNGVYDAGEPFIDLGSIDPNPAMLKLPIKNSAPTISWNVLSTHPDTSFPVMSFMWDANDIDGNSTIKSIRIALNDTNNFVSLNGTVKIITIRTSDFSNPNPSMDILINGDPNNQPYDNAGQKIKLPGLLYNSQNIFYVQALDISGAVSPWLSSKTQPTSKPNWYVKKPKGNIVIVSNFSAYGNPISFYKAEMDSIGISNKYDVYDIVNQKPPFLNTTFLETIKLYKGVIWYTDNNPSLDLANAIVQKYTNNGGKIFFSMLFPVEIDLSQIQGFLPILPDSVSYANIISAGVNVRDTSSLGYPNLKVTTSFARVRGFYLNPGVVTPVYYFPKKEVKGYIGFENKDKNIFFLGMPLNQVNGNAGSVKDLLNKVLFQDFGIEK